MRCLLPLLMIYSCINAYGQTINGILTDGRTGQRISGAWVTSAKAGTISGLQGEFAIKANSPIDTIRVKMQGYKPYMQPVDASANKNILIRLEEAVIELDVVHVTAKRDRVKDSLNNRAMFAKEFNTSAPKLKDILVVSHSPGPLPVFGVTVAPSQLIRAITYKHSKEYKFKKVLVRDENNRYIDSRFSERLVTEISGLKDDSLLSFMDRYRPTIDQIKKMTDYDIRIYIKNNIPKFRSDTLLKTK
ncbi:carboxypeptidase-like regulatory domain-containing protein [Mucilaginibacter sabulilitoris]|uniref:Carboxypeptidase-like regulatory domain-containing protein n=1 Tax=Mucilaginibacter sabulilitoris TaxID=1173583 RepID=A0ABZ0TP63_9SPHI|nr:carboxypeptidase-like regulatory domain-containing protein [Mucilaginibacter sabulilitoris]WPU94591.1 carboxypeptidase-like regulatory domain-containing protein [Mucilaginibacter sabulilitoris]